MFTFDIDYSKIEEYYYINKDNISIELVTKEDQICLLKKLQHLFLEFKDRKIRMINIKQIFKLTLTKKIIYKKNQNICHLLYLIIFNSFVENVQLGRKIFRLIYKNLRINFIVFNKLRKMYKIFNEYYGNLKWTH